MDRIKLSNRINRLGCGSELLYCTRVYVNARLYGGAWIPMEYIINYGFWLLCGQKQHCKASYIMERKWSRETKSKALQGTNQTPQGEAVCHQANQAEDAP
jgi:hypothetical protein